MNGIYRKLPIDDLFDYKDAEVGNMFGALRSDFLILKNWAWSYHSHSDL